MRSAIRQQHCVTSSILLRGVACCGGSSDPEPHANRPAFETVLFEGHSDGITPQSRVEILRSSRRSARMGRCSLSRFCCSRVMSDVTLIASDRQFPAHRVILASASAKFQKLLSQGTEKKEVGKAKGSILRFLAKPNSFLFICANLCTLG